MTECCIDCPYKREKKKYKLYIRQFSLVSMDYEVYEKAVQTDNIYETIGRLYSSALCHIARINWEEIKEDEQGNDNNKNR